MKGSLINKTVDVSQNTFVKNGIDFPSFKAIVIA
jgi:hypothetical protein